MTVTGATPSEPAKACHAQRPAATPSGMPMTAASPMYAAPEVTPGSREISVIGYATGAPGSVPGTLTSASLALLDVR